MGCLIYLTLLGCHTVNCQKKFTSNANSSRVDVHGGEKDSGKGRYHYLTNIGKNNGRNNIKRDQLL